MEGKMFLINAIFQKEKNKVTNNSNTMVTTISESTYRRFSTFPSESKCITWDVFVGWW